MQQIVKRNCIETSNTNAIICNEYLIYLAKNKDISSLLRNRIKKILSDFCSYLSSLKIKLASMKIIHIDSFIAKLNQRLAPSTFRLYLYYLRQFLIYLYKERKILKRNLSLLMEPCPRRAQITPPKYLQDNELRRLFNSADILSKRDIRSYAILHLSYEFGLLPKEICTITLDDIRFRKNEINIRSRNYEFQLWLPMSEKTIKAIVFYMVRARPQTEHRTLFLKLKLPYEPISSSNVCGDLSQLMHKVNLSSSSYWLRHTYAKNLLELGASTYEIKEILSHERMKTAERYLQIHVKLTRQILFDETL